MGGIARFFFAAYFNDAALVRVFPLLSCKVEKKLENRYQVFWIMRDKGFRFMLLGIFSPRFIRKFKFQD